MEFDKIRFDGTNVELEWKEPLLGGGVRDVSDRGKDPTPAFKNALQAFTGYVLWVHSLPESMADRVDVRGVTIKRPEDEPRGITVAALLRCPRAHNSTSTLNTPYLCEGAGGGNSGFLPESTIEMVNALEAQATLYQQGERGEQTALSLETSENAKEFDERAAHVENLSTRKPRRGKGKAKGPRPADTGVDFVANPGADEPVTDENLREFLLKADRDVSVEAIAKVTSSEREAAFQWAIDPESTDEPEWIKAFADPSLVVDGWQDAPPPKLGDAEVHAIRDAARGD